MKILDKLLGIDKLEKIRTWVEAQPGDKIYVEDMPDYVRDFVCKQIKEAGE